MSEPIEQPAAAQEPVSEAKEPRKHRLSRAPHTLPHLASRVFGTPLIISRRGLDVVLAVMSERLNLADAPSVDIAIPATRRNRKPYAMTDDGIAVISIVGPLVYRDSGDALSGGPTTYGEIEAEFADAAADPSVKGILLDIDSPGGEVSGCFDLVDMMYQARGSKPIYAAVNDSGFSAAYAIASAADQIFVTRTGGVGSVGVIAMHVDQSGFDAKLGAKYTAIIAGDRKNDFSPHAPLTDQAQASLQAEVDRLYDLFVMTVARNRNLNPQAVKDTQAGLFWGAQGVPAGFADQVGTPADAIAAMRQAITGETAMKPNASTVQPAAEASAEPMTPVTPEDSDEDGDNDQDEPKDEDCPDQPEQKSGDESLTAVSAANPTQEQQSMSQTTNADAQPSTINAAQEIASLCIIAGRKDLAAEFISKGSSLAEVREALLDLRAKASEENTVRSIKTPQASAAIENLERQAEALAANGSVTKQQAFARAIRSNPSAYSEYLRQNPQLDGGKTAEAFAAR